MDLLVRHSDLPAIVTALQAVGFEYLDNSFNDVTGGGLERTQRIAIHLVYCASKYQPDNVQPAPEIDAVDDRENFHVQKLDSLVEMKLVANRTIDKVHLRDLIDVGLIDASWLSKHPPSLAERLKYILETPDG